MGVGSRREPHKMSPGTDLKLAPSIREDELNALSTRAQYALREKRLSTHQRGSILKTERQVVGVPKVVKPDVRKSCRTAVTWIGKASLSTTSACGVIFDRKCQAICAFVTKTDLVRRTLLVNGADRCKTGGAALRIGLSDSGLVVDTVVAV